MIRRGSPSRPTPGRRVRWAVAAPALLWGVQALAAPPILPFESVRPGMRGEGRTVFHGTEIERFDVEVLGKLTNIGPEQNLILARLSGGPLEHTGVMAGMSGSPVWIDGRLIGAVAYGWGFSTEPVAGITPIEEMLRVAAPAGGADAARAVAPRRAAGLDALLRPAMLAPRLHALAERLRRGGAGAPLPLSIAGIGPPGLARVRDALGDAAAVALQVGGAGGTADEPVELLPGAAMGVKLVRGDVDMTATGTVTWVEEDSVLAFGHPLFGLGSIDLPLTGARVEALLPSLMQSARVAVPLAEIGAVRQDRATGIAGVVGARPQMIPVRVRLTGSHGDESEFAFDVADDPLLSPLLLYVTLNGILASKESGFGSATIRLLEGSVIKLLDQEDVELDNVFAGPEAFEFGTGLSAYVLYLLMNNTWTRPRIVGVNLLLDYDETPRTARVQRVSLDRYVVRAGESVDVTVALGPYRGAEQRVTRTITVPEETPPGKLRVAIGGAEAVSRQDGDDEPLLPHDLDQLIWLINHLRRNDRVYILASREDTGVLLRGARLPNLPPSAATLLMRPSTEGNLAVIPQRSVLEEVVPTDFAIEGVARVQLEVAPR